MDKWTLKQAYDAGHKAGYTNRPKTTLRAERFIKKLTQTPQVQPAFHIGLENGRALRRSQSEAEEEFHRLVRTSLIPDDLQDIE
ncbi:hypothetical protein KKA02_01675 [Patescibacteria group bacterium]|nr:hypothetical protein [Patescibacteria group bacterium]